MVALSAFFGLFGCQKAPKHTVGDICEISASRSGMCSDYSYGFVLKKENYGWDLSANCLTESGLKIEFEENSLSDLDVNRLLETVREKDLIAFAEKYKGPDSEIFADDEDDCVFILKFSDGETILVPVRADYALEEEFFRLAEKFGVPKNE